MIDTHAHLDFTEYNKDREEVISRAFNNGVKAMINAGVDLETSRKSIDIAKSNKNIFASVGIHPHYFSNNSKTFQGSTFPSASSADSSRSNLFEELKKIAKNKKVVAIGECGLDYFSHTADPVTTEQKETQKRGFLAQIEIAEKLDLPVIVHCRDAWGDLFEIISGRAQGSNLLKFVLHCYSGNEEDTEKFLKLPNVYFSFSGNITFPKPKDKHDRFTEVIKMIPLDKIMIDSDSPYLAPQEFRGKRNEPAYIRYIVEKIAQIKNIGLDEVEKATDQNAISFFGLPI